MSERIILADYKDFACKNFACISDTRWCGGTRRALQYLFCLRNNYSYDIFLRGEMCKELLFLAII